MRLQVRDEFRQDFDGQRGGWGKFKESEIKAMDEGLSSPGGLPQQGDAKRRRTGGQEQRRQPVQQEEENPRFRGRRNSDDEDDR